MSHGSHFSRIFQGSQLHQPKILTLSITRGCNLYCGHCFVNAGSSPGKGPVESPLLHRLISEFSDLGGTGIRITGGEPLCHPEWRDLILTACTMNFSQIFLQTNAILLTDVDAAFLKRADFPGLNIQISLDGASPGTNDAVRGEGSFFNAIEGIRRLVQAGLSNRTSLFFTEMEHNIHEFPALLDLAETLSIGKVESGTLVPFGRAADNRTLSPPLPEQYLALLKRFDADPELRKRYLRIGSSAFLNWNPTDRRTECCSFAENPYITPDGTLHPCVLCHADDYSVQSVFDIPLGTAFTKAIPLWSDLRKISEERSTFLFQCNECTGREACEGGCMGRAWSASGELISPDDRCVARKAVYTRAMHQKDKQ